MIDKKDKPEIDEMWKFIDNFIRPNKLVPDKTSLTYEQVLSIFSILSDMDEMFKEITQINILQKEIDKEKSEKCQLLQ
jgi:hypothetical protein